MPRKKKPEPEAPKCLELSELKRIEINHEQEALRKMESSMIEKDMKIKLLEIDKLKKDLELMQLRRELLGLKHKEARDKHLKFIDELKEKYQISGKWGFNPDTGEIKF